MIGDYSRLENNSIVIDKDAFNKEDMLNASFILKDRLYTDFRDIAESILSYNFIIDEYFYMFICLYVHSDNYGHPNYDDLDDLLYSPFYIKEIEEEFIKNCNNFKVLRLNTNIIYDAINEGEVCDYEMQYLVPMLRKYKIKNLLNG